jgi:hypothetical protein
MSEKGKELNYLELLEKVENLSGVEKRYYQYLPDVCTKTEKRQASEMKIGRAKVQRLKRKLVKEGILDLILEYNGKRNNPKHKLLKTIPTILSQKDLSYARYTLEENDDYSYAYYIKDIDWSLLQEYTAEDINKMSKLEKIQLYMDCGFIVLPTHYPIFTEDGTACSCKDGIQCPNIGKHPIHCYAYIDCFEYEKMKSHYLKEFENNPNLNIGFKVVGYSVLDVDNRHEGDKTLEQLIYEYDLDLSYAIIVNCSNGLHIYLRNKGLKNTAGVIGDGLDIRSEGGFIVAPGSLHKSGKIYEWKLIGELAAIPDDWFETDSPDEIEEIEETKQGLGNKITSIKLQDIKLPKTLTSDYVIKVGARELTLFKWGCSQRGKGASAEQIYDALITIRDTYCEEGDEPLSDKEIRNIADSAAKYPTNNEKLALKP